MWFLPWNKAALFCRHLLAGSRGQVGWRLFLMQWAGLECSNLSFSGCGCIYTIRYSPSLPCFSSLKWKSKSGHWFVFYLLKHSGHFYSVRHLSLRHLCLLSIVPCPALGSDGGVRKGELENAAGWEGAPLRIQEVNLHRGYLLCPPGTLPQSSTSSNIIWGMYPLILMHIVNLSFPKKQDSLCFALTFSKLEI